MSKSKPQPRPKTGGRFYVVNGDIVAERNYNPPAKASPKTTPENMTPKGGDK
jgi:hypothetical protein